MDFAPTRVNLGPCIDLHRGVHGSMMDTAPGDIVYQPVDAYHLFVFPQSALTSSPFLSAHWGEFVDVGAKSGITHSARWPVLNQPGWVVDTDDLGYPLLGGRYLQHPDFRRQFRGRRTAEFELDIRRRSKNMLAAYAHSSCVSLLLRSEATAESARRWISDLDPTPDGDKVMQKIRVVYPAQRPVAQSQVEQKWLLGTRMQVVFCGYDFETKNGGLALDVFGAVSRAFPEVAFVYIGFIPHESRGRYQEVLERRIRYIESPQRECVLSELHRSHILFHPSYFESVGIVFLEAASSGLAVITASGDRMSHVQELFGTGGALFVDRNSVASVDECAAFENHLRTLLSSFDLAKQMGFRNYEMCVNGPFSLMRRDAVLRETYEAAACRSGECLRLESLPHLVGTRLVRLHSRELEHARREADVALGSIGCRVCV